MSAKIDPNSVPPEFQDAKNEKTEEVEKTSEIEIFRVQLKKFMQTSSFGRTYSNFLLVLSVLSCFQFIIQTYASNFVALIFYFDKVEKALAGLFSFDWCLNFFMADHKGEFVNRLVKLG